MLRKIIAGFLTLTIAFALLTGCSQEDKSAVENGDRTEAMENTVQTQEDKKDQAVDENQNQDAVSSTVSSKSKVSVTPPAGWEEVEGAALVQYMKETASFIVSCDTLPSEVKSPDEYVEYAKNVFKKTFTDANFSDATKITVNGIEGRDFTFTTTVSGMKMKFRIVYLLKDSLAYTLTCTNFGDGFDAVASDYQAMIDSFKLQ